MKRAWMRVACLAAAFALLAGAATLWLFGSAAISNAAGMPGKDGSRFSESIVYEPCGIYSAEGPGSGFDKALQELNDCLAECPEAQYNLLVLSSNIQSIVYKLNDQYMSGEKFEFQQAGESIVLNDTQAGRQYPLKVRYAVLGDAAGLYGYTAEADENMKQWENTAADAVNALIMMDRTYYTNITSQYKVYCWLYNDAVEAYLNGVYPGKMRAEGETLLWLAAAVFGVYWLGLALWVYLDARRLGRIAWKWGALTLALNVAGLVAYIIARSQRFASGPSCDACGKPLERRWIRCPHCGEKAGEM